MKQRVVGVIPARWGSTRFPGKSLAGIAGKPMIQWVVERVRQAECLSGVAVATDDERIADGVKKLGFEKVLVKMTRSDHPSGTDRIAEAVEELEAEAVVNIQGDEPLIDPKLIDELAQAILSREWDMVTAATLIREETEVLDPSVVKVVFGKAGQALYFSRAPIPYVRDATEPKITHWRHIGIYAYRKDYLMELVKHPPCLLEETEKLEQLRALDMGCRMKVLKTEDFGIGVDVPSDAKKAEELMQKHGLS
jgi:3-deoxy-manno-octulosonate cytidylyltransferase (CMP-KDO synthetase)